MSAAEHIFDAACKRAIRDLRAGRRRRAHRTILRGAVALDRLWSR